MSTKPNSFLCKLGIHQWDPWSDGKNIKMVRIYYGTGKESEYMAVWTTRRCQRCNKLQENIT